MVEFKENKKLDEIIKFGLEKNAVDIQLNVGSTPRILTEAAADSQNGNLVSFKAKDIEGAKLSKEEVLQFAKELLNVEDFEKMQSTGNISAVVEHNGLNLRVLGLSGQSTSILIRLYNAA